MNVFEMKNFTINFINGFCIDYLYAYRKRRAILKKLATFT